MQQPNANVARRAPRSGLTPREIAYTVGGGVAALILIAAVWMFTARQTTTLPTVGEVNRPAPDFTLPALGGGEVRLSDYRGKVVLVNFWGTWCEPCREETPALQAAYEQLRERGLVVVGIDLTDGERAQGRGETEINQFVSQYGVTYPIALDVDGKVANAFRIYPIPTSYFIDPEGNIRYVRVSTLSTKEVVSLFESLQKVAQR